MPPARSLTVLHVAAPGEAGGLESVVLELTIGLTQAGHHIVLAAVSDLEITVPSLVQRAALSGVVVHRIVVPHRGYREEFRQLRMAIKDVRPDVVHTHGYRSDLLGGLAARKAGVPWVATAHGFTGGDRKNRLYEWLQVRAYRQAQAVIAVSAPIRDRLTRQGVVPARSHVLQNAWTPKVLLAPEAARLRLGLRVGEPIVGWVGRLTRGKGADVFLEALARLPDRRWRASIVGDGPERSNLKRQARALGIADRVVWHGLVPEAAPLYSAFDVWVLSSRTEGTPIALFEAMSARVPAVVTSVGGVPDVVSAAEALLVPSDDPAALAAAVAHVFADPAGACVRAEAAHARLGRAFALHSWLDAHEAIYQRIRTTSHPEA